MSVHRYGRLLALMIVFVLGLAACGGGGAEETSPDEGDAAASPDAAEPAEPADTEAADDGEDGEATGEPIRIGTLTSLTGPFTPWGVQVQAGMQLAADELNAEGGVDGRPIEIVEADTQNNPEEAVTSFERMVEQDGVVAVGGIISSDVGLATGRTAEELGVPLFLVKAGSQDILNADSRHTFRTCLPAAPMVAGPVLQFIQDQGQSKVGAVIADYAWGQSVRGALEDTVGEAEGIDLQAEVAPVDEQDFTTYLRRLEEFGPDILVATGHPPGTGPIAIQAADLGIDVPVTGAWSPVATVMEALGDVGIDKYSDFACVDYASDSYQDLAQRVLESSDLAFAEDDAIAGHGIVNMVAEAVTEVGDDPGAVAEYLHDNSFELPGYSHTMAWTEWGELAESQPTFSIVRDQAPPEGVAEVDWYPEVLITAEPLEPYEP